MAQRTDTGKIARELRAEERLPHGRKMRPDIIRTVEQLIAGQFRASEIAARVHDKYLISVRQAHRYIAHVRNTMASEEEECRPYHKHYVRATLRAIVQRALAEGNLAAGVAACDRIARLDGLYADAKVEVKHSGQIDQRILDMPRDQRRARLDELFALYSVEGAKVEREALASRGDDGSN